MGDGRTDHDDSPTPSAPRLRRALGLPLLVLYGLGVTIGAGIYVLVGATAARAGVYAPAAFLIAGVVMAVSAASFAEFVGRRPESAGEAAYVRAGFGRNWLAAATGGLVAVAGIIAAAAIAIGCAGYLAEIVALPVPVLAVAITLLMGLVAAWGVKESVGAAGIMTMVEIGGLLIIVVAGIVVRPEMLTEIADVLPPVTDGRALGLAFSASLLAFFAFIGFDALVNLAEETANPARTMPWAIGISIVLVMVIYFLVVFVAVKSVALGELSASHAPVGLLFERLTGMPPLGITLVAIIATANGIVIQIIMVARVIYGMSARKTIRAPWLGQVNRRTQTPVNATVLVTAIVAVMAAAVPLEDLAEVTSQVTLGVFALVNAALVMVKLRREPAPEGVFTVPTVVPVVGTLLCAGLLILPLFL